MYTIVYVLYLVQGNQSNSSSHKFVILSLSIYVNTISGFLSEYNFSTS